MKLLATKVKKKIFKGRSISIPDFEDGTYKKDKQIKRSYLNADESNAFMVLMALEHMLKGTRATSVSQEGKHMSDWYLEKGVITKDQKKNLKLTTTYLVKYLDDVFNNNLDSKTKESIFLKYESFDFKIIDNYTITKLNNMFTMDGDIGVEQNMFYDLVESKMHTDCKGCIKDHASCELHTFFVNHFVPAVPVDGEDKCNCEYAY